MHDSIHERLNDDCMLEDVLGRSGDSGRLEMVTPNVGLPTDPILLGHPERMSFIRSVGAENFVASSAIGNQTAVNQESCFNINGSICPQPGANVTFFGGGRY